MTYSAKGGAKIGAAGIPETTEAANPMWVNGFGDSRGGTRTRDPGIMRNGGAPRPPALPCVASGTERNGAARIGADDSAKGSAKNASPDAPVAGRKPRKRRRPWAGVDRRARLLGADLTHAAGIVAAAALTIAHPGRRGWT
jgi:hypothetical protein